MVKLCYVGIWFCPFIYGMGDDAFAFAPVLVLERVSSSGVSCLGVYIPINIPIFSVYTCALPGSFLHVILMFQCRVVLYSGIVVVDFTGAGAGTGTGMGTGRGSESEY